MTAEELPKLDRMLTGSATFGPTILEWRRHRSIPWRTKLVAIGLMSAMIAVSAVLFVRPWWAQALLFDASGPVRGCLSRSVRGTTSRQ